MANDTRLGRMGKNDETNSSRKKAVKGKESSTLGSAMIHSSGLRRSTRETPSQKQMDSTPSTTRKSERFEKRMPTSTPVKRKLEIVEKQRMASPLRRSDRGKERLLLSSPASVKSVKGSGSSDDSRKMFKGEKSVKQLTPEARDISRGENQDPKPDGAKKKMDGRTFKGMIKLKRRRDTAPDRGQRFGKRSEVESDEVGKKRHKVVNYNADPASPRPRLNQDPGDEGGDSGVPADEGFQFQPRSSDSITHTKHTNPASTSTFPSNGSSLLPEVHIVDSAELTGLRDVQNNLRVLLKPKISKLCEVIQLSEDVKVMVGKFLDYVIDNHQVNREPMTILQAFQISVCWIAASLLKHEIDKKESLALAKQHLNFDCTAEEAYNVHSKLRLLKKTFLHELGHLKVSKSSKYSLSTAEDNSKKLADGRMTHSVASCVQSVKVEVTERSANCEFASDRLISEQEQAQKQNHKELSKSVRRIQKKCDKRMIKLILKQQEETKEFDKNWEEDSVKFEKEHMLELAIVRSIHSNISLRSEKLKRLEDQFVKKMQEHDRSKDVLRKELKARHLAETEEERRKADCWLEEVKSLAQAELSRELPSRGFEFGGTSKHRVHDGPENVASPSGGLVEPLMQASEVAPSDMPETAASEAVGCGVPTDTPIIQLHPNCEPDYPNSADFPSNNVTASPHSAEQIPDEAPSDAQVPETATNEVVGGADFVEIVNPDVERNRELNPIEDLDVSVLDPVAIENDAAGSSINGGSLVESPLVQPVVALPQAGSLPQNSELQGECSQLSKSTAIYGGHPHASDDHIVLQTGMHDGDAQATDDQNVLQTGMHDVDAQASENQNALQQVEVLLFDSTCPEPTDETNHEEALVELAKQLQLPPSTDSPDHTQPDYGAASGAEHLPGEGHIASQSVGAPQEFEHPAEPSNQEVMLPRPNLALSPPLHARDVPLGQNQPDLQLEVENDRQPSSQGCTSFKNAETSSNAVEDMAGIPNQVISATDHQGSSHVCTFFQNAEASSQLVEDRAGTPNQAISGTDHQLSNQGCTSVQNAKALSQPVEDTAGIRNRAIRGTDHQLSGQGCTYFQTAEASSHPVADTAVITSRPIPGTDHERGSQGCTSLQNAETSSPPVEDTGGIPNQDIPGTDHQPNGQGFTSFENAEASSPPVEDTAGILNRAIPGTHQPCSQGCTSFQHADASLQPGEDIAGIPNQAFSGTQLGMHPPLGGFPMHLPLNSNLQTASQMLTQSLYGDPLHNELLRLHKEKEQTIKVHEETKQQLISDCDKEMEETIAEIRRKYKEKIQNAESAFLLKKGELDTNLKKVVMNKMLADAFLSKCHGLLRPQQVEASNFMQQQQLSASRPAPRPSPVTGSSPVPLGHHSSAHFPSVPARPPLINTVTPPTGNHQVGSEMRAPAPHLQPFRPSSSMPAASIPSVQLGLATQQSQRNLPTTSPSVPQVPFHSRPPPPPLPPPQPPYRRGHYDRAHLPQVTRRFGPHFNDDNQPGAHPPNILPPLQDFGLNFGPFGPLNLSQFGALANGGGGTANAIGSQVATDVVCLSDDD